MADQSARGPLIQVRARQADLILGALSTFNPSSAGPTEKQQIADDCQASRDNKSGELLKFQHDIRIDGLGSSLPAGMMEVQRP